MDPSTLLDALFACQGVVLLTGPVGPDGDSIGACLALARVLGGRGVRCTVAGSPSDRYRMLPGHSDMVADEQIQSKGWAAVVVLDGDRHRLTPPCADAFAAAPMTAIIDHHASTTPEGYDHVFLDAKSSSACEMLCAAFEARSIAIDVEVATLLYAGIAFDTGCFRYSNTTPLTLRRTAALLEHGFDHAAIIASMLVQRRFQALQLAAEVYASTTLYGRLAMSRVPLSAHARLGLLPGDLEGLVDALVHIEGIDVACLIIDQPHGVKLSLRSRGPVNVAAIANGLAPSGGGHAKAAGVVLPGEADTLSSDVAVQVRAALKAL